MTPPPTFILHNNNHYNNSVEPIAQKVYYLTFSFYAPWIHTSHMNVRRAVGYSNRIKAKTFGEKYHNKYAISGNHNNNSNNYTNTGRMRLDTEDSASTVNDTLGYSKDSARLPYQFDSFKSVEASSQVPTPQQAAGRFLTGFLRDQRYNN